MQKTLTVIYIVSLAFLLSGLVNSALAQNFSTNTFWLNLKPKLIKHLNSVIDRSKFSYEIIGPTREMKNFLGNRPNAEVIFSAFNPEGRTLRRNIIARAGNEQLAIALNVRKYKDVLVLNSPLEKGQELKQEHFSNRRILISPSDEQLYFAGNPINKVANMDLSKGTALKINMLRHEKLIKAGDFVKVSSETEFIKLEFRCQAINSGDINEIITLNCPEMTNKTQKAIVISRGIARLR